MGLLLHGSVFRFLHSVRTLPATNMEIKVNRMSRIKSPHVCGNATQVIGAVDGTAETDDGAVPDVNVTVVGPMVPDPVLSTRDISITLVPVAPDQITGVLLAPFCPGR